MVESLASDSRLKPTAKLLLNISHVMGVPRPRYPPNYLNEFQGVAEVDDGVRIQGMSHENGRHGVDHPECRISDVALEEE